MKSANLYLTCELLIGLILYQISYCCEFSVKFMLYATCDGENYLIHVTIPLTELKIRGSWQSLATLTERKVTSSIFASLSHVGRIAQRKCSKSSIKNKSVCLKRFLAHPKFPSTFV
jgi:hypothetical protein